MICHTVLLIHCDAFPRTFVFLRCSVFIFTTRRSVCSALLIVCGHICRHIQYCCRRICRESLDADSCSIESPAAAAADVGCSASVLCIRELGPSVAYSLHGSSRCDCGARHQPTFCKARPTDRPMTDRPMTGRPFWCIRRLLLEFVSDAQHCTQARACAQNHGSLSMCIHAY